MQVELFFGVPRLASYAGTTLAWNARVAHDARPLGFLDFPGGPSRRQIVFVGLPAWPIMQVKVFVGIPGWPICNYNYVWEFPRGPLCKSWWPIMQVLFVARLPYLKPCFVFVLRVGKRDRERERGARVKPSIKEPVN